MNEYHELFPIDGQNFEAPSEVHWCATVIEWPIPSQWNEFLRYTVRFENVGQVGVSRSLKLWLLSSDLDSKVYNSAAASMERIADWLECEEGDAERRFTFDPSQGSVRADVGPPQRH